MEIGIASDHAGYELKQYLIKIFNNKFNKKIIDYGCYDEESVDYPDYAYKLCGAMIKKEIEFGILVCGSGIGMSMAANRYSNELRAALCINPEMAQMTREHNNSNILCLGSRLIDKDTALEICKVFLSTEFRGGRHARRVKKLFLNRFEEVVDTSIS
jgi:ribose 5-phosphate isomerase B